MGKHFYRWYNEAEMSVQKQVSRLSPIQFGIELAKRIATAVKPVYGIKESDIPISTRSHDFIYKVDTLAENEIRKSFKDLWEQGIYYGYVTEEQGIILPPNQRAEYTYMIDPVDGSRLAQNGAENATVTMIAVQGSIFHPTFKDTLFGITHSIKEDNTYIGEKGKGVYEITQEKKRILHPRKNVPSDLKDASYTYETYSMSQLATGIVIDSLNRKAHFKTEFPCGSYSLLTLIKGGNEIAVDIRRRLVKDYPDIPVAYKKTSKSVFPMDVAAGILMIQELSGKVTDGYGKILDNLPLWQFYSDGSWSSDNQISFIAAVTAQLHNKACIEIEKGFDTLKKYRQSNLRLF